MRKTTKKTIDEKETVLTKESVVAKESVTPKKEKTKISCRSVVNGILFFEGEKTKKIYEWTDYNDKVDVDTVDLISAVQTKSRFLFNPYFIVMDDDFINRFPQLKSFYNEHYSVGDLRAIFNLPIDEIKKVVSTLPPTAITQLKQLLASAVSDGTIDSYKRIQIFDSILGTNLILIASSIK